MGKNKKIIKHKGSSKSGKPPGTLIYIGPRKDVPITIDLIRYNAEKITEKSYTNIPDNFALHEDECITWLDIKGLHNIDLIDEIGKLGNIHALTLEDLLNVNQRPKIDFFSSYVFLIVQILHYDEKNNSVESEQLSVILGENYVMTFLEGPSDIFDTLKSRMRNKPGKIRTSSSDYLVYAILDFIVDQYLDVIEKMGERIEALEEKLLTRPDRPIIDKIYQLKRELIDLRRIIMPIREIISKIEKSESGLFKERTFLYLRDLYDHVIQIIETIETYRDLTSGLADMYLTYSGNKLNEIIKVLTILSSIFIPLTFIAGVYGMNFRHMPELNWQIGYYLCLTLMLIVAIMMLIYFKWKKWM